MFAETAEEVEKSGLAEAFTSLKYDDTPTQLMLNFKKMGNDSFANGKRNQANNLQYYRDAINHYYQAFAWAQKIEPLEHREKNKDQAEKQTKTADEEPEYTERELDEMKSNLCSNAALAHLQLKNWGFVRDDSTKVRRIFDRW